MPATPVARVAFLALWPLSSLAVPTARTHHIQAQPAEASGNQAAASCGNAVSAGSAATQRALRLYAVSQQFAETRLGDDHNAPTALLGQRKMAQQQQQQQQPQQPQQPQRLLRLLRLLLLLLLLRHLSLTQ